MGLYEKYAKIREERGLTDYAVAMQTGIATSTLSEWKTGKHTPNVDKLKRIADLLEVTVDDFL